MSRVDLGMNILYEGPLARLKDHLLIALPAAFYELEHQFGETDVSETGL